MNMQRELEGMFGRSVDLIQKKELQNPYRRAEILRSHQVIYAHRIFDYFCQSVSPKYGVNQYI